MAPQYPSMLTATERVLRWLTILNALYGVALGLLLLATLAAPQALPSALVGRPVNPAATRAMRLVMLVGLAAVPIVNIILARLRAIVETVRAGDPFVLGNAARLNAIAFAVLALELLHVAVGALGSSRVLVEIGLRLGWRFSFTPWVAVLLLLVLARVFEHGARMRADLEGTV